MSGEINVLSRTQIVIVEPTSGAISIINAGAQGPAGPAGGGGSHYEDLFGTGYDSTGPNVYDGSLPTSQPLGSDWASGPWFQAGYPYWYPPDEGGGGQITIAWGSGDPNGPIPGDPELGTDPAVSYTIFQNGNDNYGNTYQWFEMFSKNSDNLSLDMFIQQQMTGSSKSHQLVLSESDGLDFARVMLVNDSAGTYILLNARPTQTAALLTTSGGSEAGTTYPLGNVMIQVVPHPSGFAGVHMGFMRSEPSFVAVGNFVAWVDETNNKLKFKVAYKDGTTIKRGEVSLT